MLIMHNKKPDELKKCLFFFTDQLYLNMKFPALWICGLLLWIGSARVEAWGGLFNRFSPEMLSNMAFHGGSSAHRPQPLFQVIS